MHGYHIPKNTKLYSEYYLACLYFKLDHLIPNIKKSAEYDGKRIDFLEVETEAALLPLPRFIDGGQQITTVDDLP